MNANAYFNRGSAYDSLGQFDKAIADYAQALELDQRQQGDGHQGDVSGAGRSTPGLAQQTGSIRAAVAARQTAPALAAVSLPSAGGIPPGGAGLHMQKLGAPGMQAISAGYSSYSSAGAHGGSVTPPMSLYRR